MKKVKKELRFSMQNKITTYTHNAYFVCILLCYPNIEEWFYENYIQLYFSKDKMQINSVNKEIFLDFYGGWTEPRQFFEIEEIDRIAIAKVDIISYIRKCINEEKYVTTYVDEYYTLSDESNRRELLYKHTRMSKDEERHNSHDILIYGYDDKAQQFFAAGYDGKSIFCSYYLDYATFKKGFESGLQEAAECETLNKKSYSNDYFRLIKVNITKTLPYKFHIEKMKENLDEYINSVNSSLKIHDESTMYDIYKKKGNVFGINVYDSLAETLRTALTNQLDLDYRPFHTLYEHKKLMYERVEFIKNHIAGKREADGLTRILSEIQVCIIACNKLRLQCIKYNCLQKPNLLEIMINEIEKIKIRERDNLLELSGCIEVLM